MSSRWSWTTLCSVTLMSLAGCQHYQAWHQRHACDECCDTMAVMPYESYPQEMPHEVVPGDSPEKAPLPAPTPQDEALLPSFRQISSSEPIVAEPVESQQTLVPNRPKILNRLNQSLQDAMARPVQTNEPAAAAKKSPSADASQPVEIELDEDAKAGRPIINVSITVLPPQSGGAAAPGQYRAVVSTDGHSAVTHYTPQPAPQNVAYNAPVSTFPQSGVEMWPHRPVASYSATAPPQIVVNDAPAVEEEATEPASYTIAPRLTAEPPTAPSLNPLLD